MDNYTEEHKSPEGQDRRGEFSLDGLGRALSSVNQVARQRPQTAAPRLRSTKEASATPVMPAAAVRPATAKPMIFRRLAIGGSSSPQTVVANFRSLSLPPSLLSSASSTSSSSGQNDGQVRSASAPVQDINARSMFISPRPSTPIIGASSSPSNMIERPRKTFTPEGIGSGFMIQPSIFRSINSSAASSLASTPTPDTVSSQGKFTI